MIRSWYTGCWWVGCYIWYSEEGTGHGRSPPSSLLAVPNVTAHPSAASVPITVLLYNGLLLCGFNVPIKGLTVHRQINTERRTDVKGVDVHTSIHVTLFQWFVTTANTVNLLLLKTVRCSICHIGQKLQSVTVTSHKEFPTAFCVVCYVLQKLLMRWMPSWWQSKFWTQIISGLWKSSLLGCQQLTRLVPRLKKQIHNPATLSLLHLRSV